MKKMISMIAICAMMVIGLAARAEDTTVKGTIKCAKCSLKEADKCSAVLVDKDGTKYYLNTKNACAIPHKDFCQADKDGVSVTGTVTEKDGKKMLAAKSCKAE